MVIEASHDLGLVLLSLIISVWGVYSALSIMSRVHSLQNGQRTRAMLAISILLGVTIWAMHFIGMLAYNLPLHTTYDPFYIFLSLCVSIIASVGAMSLVLSRLNNRSILLGGVCLGAAVGGMHFTGMLAFKLSGEFHINHLIVGLALLIAIVVGVIGLYLMRLHVRREQKGSDRRYYHLQASLILGLGFSAVHYIAMGAVTVHAVSSDALILTHYSVLSHAELALLVLSMVCLIITLMPLLVINVEFESGTLGGSVGYWLLGIGILGITMTILGQWFMSNSFQKEMSLTQVGYRIQGNLNHLNYLQGQVNSGRLSYDIDDWSASLEDVDAEIKHVMSAGSMVSLRNDQHIRVELQNILIVLDELKGAITTTQTRAGPQFSEHVDVAAQLLRSATLLSDDLLSDAQQIEARNRKLFGVINGANILWFILVFSSVVVVMRHRQMELEAVNDDLNFTLRELQHQKYALDQHVIVAITDPSGCITYANDEFCRISCYERDELIGQKHSIVNAGYHCHAFWQQLWATISSGKVWQGEIKNRNKNGEFYWVFTTIVPFMDKHNRPERYLSLRTDITAIKQAELDLREKEYWMNSLIQALPDEILLEDAEERWLIANDVMLRNLGLRRDEYQGLTSKQLAEKNEVIKQRLLIDGDEERIWQHDDLVHWELEYPTVQGKEIFDVVNVPLFKDDNSRKGVVRVARDISIRKRMEEENQMLASAVFQADEGMFIANSEGCLEYVNPAYEGMLCPGDEDCMGQSVKLLCRDFVGEELATAMWNALSLGESWSGRYVGELNEDGNECNLMISISPVYTAKGMRYVGVIRDITDEMQLENRLNQAQKMESIGRLAGGIAHDFNNILTAIIGYSDLVLDDLPAGSDAYNNMKEIQTASQRAKELVKQILTFSRRSNNKQQTFEAEQLLKEAVRLIRATIPASISIDESYTGMPMMLEMDPTQLHQVVMNLCVNAAQAMGEQGKMIVQTDYVPLSQTSIVPSEDQYTADYYFKLVISDNGPGIPDGMQEKVFEPFFTTKEIGSGTGMGLAAVHGVVVNNFGEVKVSNNAEGGARFEIYLPLVNLQKDTVCRLPQRREAEDAPEYIGSVLYVDDEVPLTNVIQKFLIRQGFHVDVANDPLEALELFKADPQKYDVVVSDQVMPNMRGDQLAGEMLALRADIPFLLCSGYSDAINIEAAKQKGMREFLQKPLDFKVFSELLKNIIKN